MQEDLLKELKDISILCVEDEDGIREMIVSTLKFYFKEVYEAIDGNEAYELYDYYKPKIVLTDIQMKNCNGLEFVKKIRKNDTETMIIMLTAHSKEEYLMELINLNINHFILKPLNSKKLNEALGKYLTRTLKPILLCEGLVLDLQKRELIYQENEIIPLRKREKDFLYLLYKKKYSLLKYEEIEFELWNDKDMTTHALKSFIKELRKIDKTIPVILLSAFTDTKYLLEATKLKLVDYLTKPVDFKTLNNSLQSCVEEILDNSRYLINFQNNIQYNVLHKKFLDLNTQQEITLTSKELDLVNFLIKNSNRIVSSDELKSTIWEDCFEATDSALKNLLNKVRKKIGKDSISNISGVGYRLNF